MAAFTAGERKSFRFKKYIKDHMIEYIVHFLVNLLFTEAIVYLCGGSKYLLGGGLALGYTLGWAVQDVWHYKKEWLDVDIQPDNEAPEKTEN